MTKDQVIALLNVTALMAIMLSMGLQVRFADVMASARRAHLVVLGLFANYVLVPATTLGLLYLFQANPVVSVGFLILAVCPGAPIGPPAAAIARGNVALAIAMMVILAAFSAILSPALLGLLLTLTAPDSDFRIDSLAIVRTLLVTQLLPLALGLDIHHRAPKLTRWIVKPINLLANGLLLLLIGLILSSQYETLSTIQLRGWTGMTMLLLASLGIGWLCGGPDVMARKAIAVTTASRNVVVGLMIVTSNFAGTPAVTAVVAFGLISIVGTFGCALLIRLFFTNESKNAQAG